MKVASDGNRGAVAAQFLIDALCLPIRLGWYPEVRLTEIPLSENMSTGGRRCLVWVEVTGLPDIFKILVFGPHHDQVLSPLQPVLPFLQGHFNGQKFPVPHIIVPFYSW